MKIFLHFQQKLIFIFFLFLFQSVSLNDMKDNQKFYFCSGKIFVNDYDINTNEINRICTKILYDDRILISIQNDLEVNGYSSDMDNYFTRDSEEFFMRQCGRISPTTCDYGFMISLYTRAKKVRITAGRISKNIITASERTKIISSAKSYLSERKYSDAIVLMTDHLKSSSPYISDSTARYDNYRDKKEESSGSSFWTIIIFVICPCLCCIFCLYRYYQTIDNTNNTSGNTADEVRQHINQLDMLLKQIRNNNPPIISIDQCLLCMNRIQGNNMQNNYNPYSTPNDMQNNLIMRDDLNTRYSCGHVYHNACLHECNLSSCIMCPGNVHSSQIVPNNNSFQVVDENHVGNLMRNIHRIYDKHELNQYASSYPNEASNYNSSWAWGLAAVGGVAAIAGTAYMLNEMNQPSMYDSYQQPMYNQSNYNNYGSDGNYPDTAEGDFD